MGGTAVSAGADYQAAVAAYVAVRMLLERPLNWAGVSDDTPAALEGEVGGPGDDLRVAFGVRRAPLHTQCKRALAGPAALKAAITDVAERLGDVPSGDEVALLVGPGSSVDVRDVFATDVRNFRQGRRQGFRRITQSVLDDVRGADAVLSRLHVVPLDVGVDSDAGAQFALDGLRQVLTAPERAGEAWTLLVREGLRLAQRGRWDRAGVEQLLRGHGFQLRPVGPDAPWIEQIDIARRLTTSLRPKTAAGLLDHLAAALDGRAVGADVRRQFHTARGAAALSLGAAQRGREHFARALEHVPAPETRPDPHTDDQREQRTRWANARHNYGRAILLQGDTEAAERAAREILEVDPRRLHAWALLTAALSTRGVPLEEPPADLADTPEYRDALADAAARRRDWRGAVEAAGPALSAGHRTPGRLSGQAQALVNIAADLPDGDERRRTLEQAERAADEAIRLLANAELDGPFAHALFVRGHARHFLGQLADAEADYQRAEVLAPTDPNVVMRAVRARRGEGDVDGALALLPDAVVESAVALRMLRAEVRAEAGACDAAVDDVRLALDELPAVATPATEGLLTDAGHLAIIGGEADLAERAANALEAARPATVGPDLAGLRGRIAAVRGNWDAAEVAFRSAAAAAEAEYRSDILGELALRLGRAGLHARAVAIYEEIGAGEATGPQLHNFVTALMYAERYDRVLEVLAARECTTNDAGSAGAAIPPPLLDAATDIAWRREDYASAARWLDLRIGQVPDPDARPAPGLLLLAAQAHANIGNDERGTALVDAVLADADLTPEDRMRAANVLSDLGAGQRAIDTAFTAVRARPSDQDMVVSFIKVVIAPDRRERPATDATVVETPPETAPRSAAESAAGDDTPELHADPEAEDAAADVDADVDDDVDDDAADGRRGTVGTNTFVRVRTDDGQRYEYFLYSEPPTDPRLGEYPVTDPVVADLVGKQVGDVVVRNRGTWQEERLRVDRVMPAVVVVFRRYLRTFAARFPGTPPFRLFHVGKRPSLDKIGPMLASLHASAANQRELLARYEESPIPLGTLADLLGKPLIDLVWMLAADPARRIHADVPPLTDYGISREAAASATTAVLTRPALEFLDALGLFDVLASRYRLVVPRSMMDEWAEELRRLEETARDGRVALGEAGARAVVEVRAPGATEPAFHASRTLHDRVCAVADVRYRPLSALTAADAQRREVLGAASADAVSLAQAEGAALYADDAMLRCLAFQEAQVSSFSTAILLDVLREGDLIDDGRYDAALVRLIEWGHDMVPVRGSTVVAAFGAAGSSAATADRVLARLADPRITPESATLVGVSALRLLATPDLATTTFEFAADRVADALVRARATEVVLSTAGGLLRDAFRLLPNQRRTVESALRRAVQRRWVVRPSE